jgi:hypothetical protein
MNTKYPFHRVKLLAFPKKQSFELEKKLKFIFYLAVVRKTLTWLEEREKREREREIEEEDENVAKFNYKNIEPILFQSHSCLDYFFDVLHLTNH